MVGHKIIIRDGFEHRFFYLDDQEKKIMLDACKTVAEHERYWLDKLSGIGIVVKRLLRIQQWKDQGGEWMNVFKINYL